MPPVATVTALASLLHCQLVITYLNWLLAQACPGMMQHLPSIDVYIWLWLQVQWCIVSGVDGWIGIQRGHLLGNTGSAWRSTYPVGLCDRRATPFFTLKLVIETISSFIFCVEASYVHMQAPCDPSLPFPPSIPDCQQQAGLSAWVPFHESASAVTQLYKGRLWI